MAATAGAHILRLEPLAGALHVEAVTAAYAELKKTHDGGLAVAADCDAGLARLTRSQAGRGRKLLETGGTRGVRRSRGERLGRDGVYETVLHGVRRVLQQVEATEDVDPALVHFGHHLLVHLLEVREAIQDGDGRREVVVGEQVLNY